MGLALAVKRVWRFWDVERWGRRVYPHLITLWLGTSLGLLIDKEWFSGEGAGRVWYFQAAWMGVLAMMWVRRLWAWRGIRPGVRVDVPTAELRALRDDGGVLHA